MRQSRLGESQLAWHRCRCFGDGDGAPLPVAVWQASRDSRDDRHYAILTATSCAKVDAHYLHEIRLEQVHIPPGRVLDVGHGAGARLEVLRRAAVDGLLRRAMSGGRRLHGRLAEAHVEHCA